MSQVTPDRLISGIQNIIHLKEVENNLAGEISYDRDHIFGCYPKEDQPI
jgi:hypothetical protein